MVALFLSLFLVGGCTSCAAKVHEMEPIVVELLEPDPPPEAGFFQVKTSTVVEDAPEIDAMWQPDSFPLFVLIDPPAEEMWGKDLEMAVAWWNKKLGFTAFLYLGPMDIDPDSFWQMDEIVLVTLYPVPSLDNPHYWFEVGRSETGLMVDRETGLIGRALIGMTQNEQVRTHTLEAQRQMRHELGHALGLDHDTSTSSLMYHISLNMPYDLSDYDQELLRQKYRGDMSY